MASSSTGNIFSGGSGCSSSINTFSVRIVSAPAVPIASRAFTARLITTCSSCPWSTRTGQISRPCCSLKVMFSPINRRIRFARSASVSVIDTSSAFSVCLRENARSWRTKFAARFAFCLICIISANDWSPAGWRINNKSLKPIIAVSKLLKSCAMPPANCPTACIFCEWANRISKFFCSVRSIICTMKPSDSTPSRRLKNIESVHSSLLASLISKLPVGNFPSITFTKQPATASFELFAKQSKNRQFFLPL